MIPLARAITKLNAWTFRLAALAIFAIVALMALEVVSRYAFSHPTEWAPELSTLVFGPYFQLGGPHLLHLGGHVAVDIVSDRASGRFARILKRVGFVLAAGFAAVLLYFSLPLAINSFNLNETSYSSWNPVVWPAKLMLPLACFLMAAQALAELVLTIAPDEARQP